MLVRSKTPDTFGRPAPLDRAIDDVRAGKPVIICDAPDREGEGDFALAAWACTPEMIGLLLRRGSGVLCLALPPQDADRIGICALAHNSTDRFATRFAMPISLNDGGSGVSFAARSATIRTAADRTNGAGRFTWPGHVSTLIAHPQGLRGRGGHTEAVIDLLRLASIDGPGVLCEILDEHGRVGEREYLCALAGELGLSLVDIEDVKECVLSGAKVA